VTSFEALIGRPLATERVFYRWNESWPTADDVWTRDAGRIPFISWNTRLASGAWVPWADIAAGKDDTGLHQRAAALKAFGSPVVFAFNHEPENDRPRGPRATSSRRTGTSTTCSRPTASPTSRTRGR
jgi:hypothetical protein